MKVATLALTLCLIGGTLGAEQPIPVIFDSDIGGDIDDTWALAYLLRSPELDLKLLVTDFGDTVYRAKVAARLLEVGGRADVAIGIGIRQSKDGGPQQEWVADYSLESYPGTIHEDGVQAMIDMIRAAPEPITLIAVGPDPNLKEAPETHIVERLTRRPTDDSCRISLAQWSLHRELFSGAIDNLDFPKVAVEEFGIHHIEWVSQFFQDKAEDRDYLQQMKDRCDEHGVQSLLIMIDGEGNLGSIDPTERNQAVDNHRKWIDAAASLGAYAIRVNGNGFGEPEEIKRALVISLQELSDFAAEKGVNVLVENHGMALKDGTWTPDVPSTNGAWLADVLATVDRPNVGALPDFGNFYSYDRYQGLDDLLPYAQGISAKTNEFDSRGEDTRTDFRRMFDLIHTHGFDGYIGVEYEGPDDSGLTEYQGIQQSIDLIKRYCE